MVIGAAVVLWAVLKYTTWGFKLRVIGGNPSAARRAGLAVGGLSVAAMCVGGAMAGLGGMIEIAGTEGRLRPGLLAGVGFIGFLASWLAKHDPLKCIVSAFILGAIAVFGLKGIFRLTQFRDVAYKLPIACIASAFMCRSSHFTEAASSGAEYASRYVLPFGE